MEKDTKIEQEVTTESRRKFLKTAGKFAVYTPPALMLMSNANATYVKDSNGVIKKKYRRKFNFKKYRSKRGYIRRRYSSKRSYSYASKRRSYRKRSW